MYDYYKDNNILRTTVLGMKWDRIHMYFRIKVDGYIPENCKFYFIDFAGNVKAKLDIVSQENDIFTVHTNITNPGNEKRFPLGKFKMILCGDNGKQAVCGACYTIAHGSKEFAIGDGTKKYCVKFSDTDGDFLLETSLVAPPLGTKFKIKALIKSCVSLCYKFLCLIHKSHKPTVLFMTQQGEKLGANEQAVYDRMYERGLNKQYKIITYIGNDVSKRIGIVRLLNLINKLAKSDVVILGENAIILEWLVLNKNTKVIQLWHAGSGFKACGYSRWGKPGSPDINSGYSQYTFGISASKHIAHTFSECWGFNEERVISTGLPRMDKLFDEGNREKKTRELKEKFPFINGKKVILFAPTFRGKDVLEAHYPYEMLDFKRLYEACGEKYIVLFKNHPFVKAPVPFPSVYGDKFYDISSYPDINDLFYITDLLITDYSSNIFEYSLTRNPMLFFAFDEEEYVQSRGFHTSLQENAGGKIVHSFDELISSIENEDYEYERVEEYINRNFDFFDKNSSDRVIDWLILGNLPEEYKTALEKKNEEIKYLENLKIDIQ